MYLVGGGYSGETTTLLTATAYEYTLEATINARTITTTDIEYIEYIDISDDIPVRRLHN